METRVGVSREPASTICTSDPTPMGCHGSFRGWGPVHPVIVSMYLYTVAMVCIPIGVCYKVLPSVVF